jgi:enoyl-CoA hydratase
VSGEASVSFEKRGDVAVIRLDDGKANAMSMALIAAVEAALDRAGKEAKAIVIVGRPGRFSAGFDLKVMMSGPEAARSLVMAGGELLMKLYEYPLPTVMAVTGHAIAAGVLMAATGDRRIGAAGDFKLGLNEVANGMPVPILAHELARDHLDPRALVESVLHAKMYDPESAVRVGWLDRVVAPDELEAAAIAEAEALAKLAQPAYGMTKRSLRRQTIRYVRESMEANLAEFKVG